MYTGIMIDQKRERETETEEDHVCSVCYKGTGAGKKGSRSKNLASSQWEISDTHVHIWQDKQIHKQCQTDLISDFERE